MSPLAIEILLHYGTRANDYRDGDFSATAVRELIDAFLGPLGLLQSSPMLHQTYTITERGHAYVDALCAMALPICRWEIPMSEAAR